MFRLQSTHWQILAFCPLLYTQNPAKDSSDGSENPNPQDLHIKNQVAKIIEVYSSTQWELKKTHKHLGELMKNIFCFWMIYNIETILL